MWRRKPSRSLGFASTQELLDALPQQVPSRQPVKSSKRARRKPASRLSWVPRAGGDDALIAQRKREKHPEIEARAALTRDSGRLFIVLVGLPARGKSTIGDKLERFLNWRGWRTRYATPDGDAEHSHDQRSFGS